MPETVLIIEDNEQNLYTMQFLLERHGLTVAAARDGRTGIAEAIRLDIQLPEVASRRSSIARPTGAAGATTRATT